MKSKHAKRWRSHNAESHIKPIGPCVHTMSHANAIYQQSFLGWGYWRCDTCGQQEEYMVYHAF